MTMAANDDIDPDCRLFVQWEGDREALFSFLADLLPTNQRSGSFLSLASGLLEVSPNRDARPYSRGDEDEFLHFKFTLYLSANADLPLKSHIHTVTQILKGLWSHGCPAVAACEYEHLLPKHEGTERPN